MTHAFTLKDADGVAHSYTVEPHPPSEGFAVVSRLAAAIIDPLAGTGLSVLVSVVPDMLKLAKTPEGKFDVGAVLDNEEILDKVSGLDFSSTGPALKRAVNDLNLDTVKLILKHTSRDDRPLIGSQGALAFDTAYVRNYAEMAQAVWEVCSYNRFFPQLGGFGALAAIGEDLLRRKGSSAGPPSVA